MIGDYLSELERQLPETRRRRFLREAEEHLRDVAAVFESRGLDRAAAEAAAVQAFGPFEVVVRAFAAESAAHATRRAAVVAVAALAALIMPLYAIPENTLPPAPWVEKPLHLAVQQAVVIAAYVLALGAGLAGASLAFTRHARLTAPVLLAGSALGGNVLVLGVALSVQWELAAPQTPFATLIALVFPAAAGPLLASAAAAWWALLRRPLLATP